MRELITSPLFSIMLCIGAFEIGGWIHRKTKIDALNPLLIAIALVIVMLKMLDIPLEIFNEGGDMINLLLGPATVVLAVPMYEQVEILKKNIIPIIVATGVGALTSIGSVLLLCRVFGLDEALLASLLPKSVTTPIAVEVSVQHGGIASITIAAVVITGILGAVIAPGLIKIFKLEGCSVASGLAIGASRHAMGTSKAVQIGEIEGAMSGLAIGIMGIFTVLFSLFL